jgi:uncharacterized protein (TIGR03437 family)
VCAATAQPVVDGVFNSASYALPGLSNSGIAQGSLFAIFGKGLATGNQTASAFPLSPNMNGTSVKVTVNGITVEALMIYTTVGQLAAVLPSNTPTGTGSLTVTLNGQTSGPANIQVVRSAFGIYTLNQAGSGPGVVQIATSDAVPPVVSLSQPARPGQTLTIWGTGLGPASAEEVSKPVPGDLPVDVEVYIGGKRATVTYKGRSGCCAGIDQIAVVVPEGVSGCYIPVVVKTGDVVSNFSTIAVSGSGACSDPTGLSAADIQSAQNSGTMRLGSIALVRSNTKISVAGTSIESKTDTGAGSFDKFNLSQLLTSQSAGGSNFNVSLGACSVATFRASNNGGGFTDPIQPVALDAGPFISITGPKGTKQLTRQNGSYIGELGGGFSTGIPGAPAAAPDFLEPGSYKINNGSGGTGPDAVGAFSIDFSMPQMVTWSNESAVSSVTRSAGQEITWQGGDPNGYVQMLGFSSTKDVTAMFICMERASAGRFTIPNYVLLLLPQTSGDNIGLLSVGGMTANQRFTAPGLDAGSVIATSSTQKTVTYR